jgi:RNA polymerase sigma-70 factor (ECF subfamily)
MDRYREPIFHFIYRHVPNDGDAHELTQEVFVRLFFNAGKFKPEAKFSTWLYQIALNLCRDHAKSRHARQAARTDGFAAHQEGEHPLHDAAVANRTPSDEALAREKLAALDDGMAALPHDLRTALVLTALEQRSHLDCAALLKTTPKAVETRVYRARKFLLEWMTKAGFAFVLAALSE